ncbi:hypothetical protein F444_02737 [Phytophthora nicotianae P1976]|uniref:RxLR effector protein n=1 Tax=Phytophthora nicotianae P1976 TaxID=1317066 RepID=A0A081AWC9_PHYNI|nr:hypothetical protein F444_02737 [Phytophthora nicotianae P1976]
MRQSYFLILAVVTAFYVGAINAESDVLAKNLHIGPLSEMKNVYRNLRKDTVVKDVSRGEETEERTPDFKNLKGLFGKGSNAAKTLESNLALGRTVSMNPKLGKEIVALRKNKDLMRSLSDPRTTQLRNELAKKPIKLNEQNLEKVGRLGVKGTSLEKGKHGKGFYIANGLVILFGIGITTVFAVIGIKSLQNKK